MRIAYIAPEYGGPTSTFVYREVEELQKLGHVIQVYSTHPSVDNTVSAEAVDHVRSTVFLYNQKSSLYVSSFLTSFLSNPWRFSKAFAALISDIVFAKFPARSDKIKLIWHFILSTRLSVLLSVFKAEHLHAHFAHVPASIAMYASILSGVSFSFTAHANDIFVRGTALKEKVRRSSFVVCISEYNRKFLIESDCDESKMFVIHCGIDIDKYVHVPPSLCADIPLILCVGRLVEKKGVSILLDALSIIKDTGIDFRCAIIGNGPLYNILKSKAESLGLDNCVEFLGSKPQEYVKDVLSNASLFVLPCIIASDGDRDGIPVALMEAMAMGITVVTTDVSGISELVQNGTSGMIARPGSSSVLAEKIQVILADHYLARYCSENARMQVEKHFNMKKCVAIIDDLLLKKVKGSE